MSLETLKLTQKINILLASLILGMNLPSNAKDLADVLFQTGQKNQFFQVKVEKLMLCLDLLKVKLVANKLRLSLFLQILLPKTLY